MDKTTIFVRLLDGGIEGWRPVEAVEEQPGCYRIVEVNPDPTVERWEFASGDLVRCEQQIFRGTPSLVAIAAVK